MLHRISLMAAVVIAALAISVTPALAGEDDGNPAPPPVTTTPAPAPTVVEPQVPDSVQRDLDRLKNEVRDLKREAAKESGSGGGGGNSGASNNTASTTPVATPVVSKQVSTVPQGGVQAGGGGTAPQDSNALLPIGIGLVGLILAGGAGGLALRRRFVTE